MLKIKKILVSQPKPTSDKSPYFDIATKYNVQIDFKPFIKVEGLNLQEFRSQRIEVLDYTAVIFTARTAIDHFFRLCDEMRITIPETMKYFCVSEKIALYLQKFIKYRKRKVFFPATETSKVEELLPQIKRHADEKYLYAVSDVCKDNFLTTLQENNIHCTKAIFYKTVSADFSKEESFDYDMLVFFSPEGINSLLKNFPNYEQGETIIAALGPKTAQAVTNANLRLDIAAGTPQVPSMTGAIEAFFKENKVNKK
ncbi:MAG: uroporphyrinogen-III synthase [Paludibacteraceae bacterium]|nr:uroporphyrinogen-III synthase [Paludibacteraceae bacterium]